MPTSQQTLYKPGTLNTHSSSGGGVSRLRRPGGVEIRLESLGVCDFEAEEYDGDYGGGGGAGSSLQYNSNGGLITKTYR
jgi:hypothetical protein